MSSNKPTRSTSDENKTGEFLDQTIAQTTDSRSSVGNSDPDATHLSDSGPVTGKSSGSPKSQLGSWIGPYQLKEVIGSGGMGTVFLAEQQEPVKRQVALKIIKVGMDTQQVIARFEAERQALSMMEHDNIARVLDASATEQGRPYFVMELVRGDSVTKFCDENCLSIPERLRLFVCICDAVQHAHQKGIIHRDLKPSNLLVSMQNGKPVPKIIDFGVAKATDQRLTERTMQTQLGQVVGTLEYMSPEQAKMTDVDVDTRSDIYSLGVVLYELLTGNTPLNRQSLSSLGYLEILTRIKDDEAPKPSSRITTSEDKLANIAKSRGVDPRKLGNQLRGDLDWIVLKALEKNPDRRYETAAGLADDVERYLSAEPIDARPPTQWYLMSRFVKRHKTGVIAATAVLLTLIGGIVLATSQAVRARSAEAKVAEQMETVQKSYKQEKELAALQLAVQRENEALMSTMAADIQLKVNFGRWREALDQLDSFEQRFGELPVELAIIRLRALSGEAETRKLKKEIIRLEKMPEAKRFDSELKLWRGYAFLTAGDGKTDAKSLIQQAIDGKLSPADRLFAQGLVADSLNAAADKYRLALKQQPQHSRARMQLVVTLILLGRYEDVLRQIEVGKALFPDDTRFSYMEAVSHSLAGNQKLAAKEIRSLRGSINRVDVIKLRSLMDLSEAVITQFRLYERDGLLDWFSIMRNGLPLFRSDSYAAIPVPQFQKERIFEAYGSFGQSFFAPFMRFATEDKKHRLIIENCQEAWATHPDGMFKCFEGGSWLMLDEYEKGAEALAIAAAADSLFPEVQKQANYGLFVALRLQYDRDKNRNDLMNAIQALEASGVEEFEPHRGPMMFESVVMARRWDLARIICVAAIEKGGDKDEWLLRLLKSAQDSKNYGFALGLCDELLDNNTLSENAEVNRRRAEIIKAIAAENQ